MLHTLLLQLTKAFNKFVVCGSTKTTNTNITNPRTNHISGIHRLDGYFITNYRKLKQILDTLSYNTQTYLRTLWPTQALHDFLLRHLNTSNGCIIH